MKVVTTFHQPSSVIASVKCQLSSRDLEHLVVAKPNRLDVYSLQPHGLQHQCGLEIRGVIVSLKSVQIPGSPRSNLLLMLNHPDPELIFLAYTENSLGSQLTLTKQLSLYERIPRPAEYFTDVVVHPSGKVAAVSCYVGKLKIVKLNAGNYEEDFDVMLRELNLLGLAFLPLPEEEYSLAVLHVDYQERIQLLARDILLEDLELSSSLFLSPTAILNKIIPLVDGNVVRLVPVPPQTEDEDEDEGFLGGILVIGGRKILMYELQNAQAQSKQKSKRRRLDSKKKSTDTAEAELVRDKERDREAKARKVQGSVDWPWSEVTVVCSVDPQVPRFIIGDIFGRLALLSLESVKAQGLILIPLGEASPATSLTYLTSQTIYLGSHLGDSQLLQLSSTPVSSINIPTLPIPSEITTVAPTSLQGPQSSGKGKEKATGNHRDPTKGAVIESKGSYITVLESFKNIAPIVDAVLADTDGSGERQIVTCSGGGNKGSLNVVRNGADFQELASIPGMADVVSIWGVRDEFDDTHESHILVSTLEATHLLRLSNVGADTTVTYIKETGLTEGAGLIQTPTLAFSNVARRVIDKTGRPTYHNSQLLVQVTKKGVHLFEYNTDSKTYQQIDKWDPTGSEIVAADTNASQVFLALKNGKLLALTVDGRVFRQTIDKQLKQISAISCAPLDPAKPYCNYVVVSYWEEKTIEIFILDSTGVNSVSTSSTLPAFARSLLLYDFGVKGEEHCYYLLAGLGDGSVAYFAWKDKRLSDKKIVALGHMPVSLCPCQVDGKRAVFAAGNRATVFSWEKKRLHNSPIMLRDIVTAKSLNTISFRSSLILATPTALFIGCVRDLDKMHIRTISFGLDNPFRIIYQPSLKVYGVGIVRTEPNRIGDLQWPRSSFRLLDDTSFTTLANFNCEITERLSAATTYSPEINGKSTPVFCLGVYTDAAEVEPTEGRLLILSATTTGEQSKESSLRLSIMAKADVNGCVYAFSFVKDLIVAAVNSSVMMFKLHSKEDVLTLDLLSEWNHNYLVTGLASYDNRIFVGDQLNSVSLLEVADGEMKNLARDYGPRWPVAVEASDKDSIIASNFDSNLATFRLTSTLGRPSLECDGNFYLADFVNKFIRGSLTSDSSNGIGLEASHVFFSSSGRIGVIIEVTEPALSLHLTALQRNLAGAVTGVGGDSHTRFRAPKNKKGRTDAEPAAFGFIDGDFVEQFIARLGSPEDVKKIVAGNSKPERLTIPVQEILTVLENLQSFH